MDERLRYWPLQFYVYTKRAGLSHHLRLRCAHTCPANQAYTEIQAQKQRFGVYQRLWFFPYYIYRPDIRAVFLDQEFFYGIPTSKCLLSFGCTFVLVELTNAVSYVINSRALDSV